MIIELTEISGNIQAPLKRPLLVNSRTFLYARPNGTGSYILLAPGIGYAVEESYELIKSRLIETR